MSFYLRENVLIGCCQSTLKLSDESHVLQQNRMSLITYRVAHQLGRRRRSLHVLVNTSHLYNRHCPHCLGGNGFLRSLDRCACLLVVVTLVLNAGVWLGNSGCWRHVTGSND
jgi:hypothetical protein